MNLERRIRKLNRLLEDELGGQPQFAWIACNSAEMQHPCQVLDSSANPIYDVLCQCGRNVDIHGPYCKISASVVRGEMQPRLPKYLNWWVLAALRPVLDWEAEELRRAARPPVLWEPINCEQHPMGYMVWPHEPDERLTQGVIKMIREFRSLTPKQHGEAVVAAHYKAKQARTERARGMAREYFGRTLKPWEKGGVSYAPVPAKQQQGDLK